MIHEHALEVEGEITPQDLEYMILKANRIGKCDREITKVYILSDDFHRHVYFEVENLKSYNYGG